MTDKKRKGPFVLAYGEEDYLLDRIIERYRSDSGPCGGHYVTILDGEDITESDFVSRCEQDALDQDQVIILDNAHKMKLGKALLSFVEEYPTDESSTTIVVVYRGKKLPETWRKAALKGRAYDLPKIEPWKHDALQDRISHEAKVLGLTLGSGVPGLLLKALGPDLRITVNELRKLAYISEQKIVTAKEVALVTVLNPSVEPFEVAEAATDKDTNAALRATAVLFKNMGDGASVPITIGLMKQVEKLLIARQMLDQGKTPGDVALALDMHPFVVQKTIIPRTKKFTVGELRSQMQKLCKLEVLVKGASRSKRTLVDLAILSLTS